MLYFWIILKHFIIISCLFLMLTWDWACNTSNITYCWFCHGNNCIPFNCLNYYNASSELLCFLSCASLPPITPTWYCSRLTPSIHPYAVSPDLVNLWLDSMFISPVLELSWEICWCTTITQLFRVSSISLKVHLTQTADLEPLEWTSYSIVGAFSVLLKKSSFLNQCTPGYVHVCTNLGDFW